MADQPQNIPLPEEEEVEQGRQQTRTCLPSPGSRDAPQFEREAPANLLRFLGRYENLLRQTGITSDRAKKEEIMQYADAQSEAEWRALDKYENGTYEEFRKELIASYPEAVDLEAGSVAKLEGICKANPRIGATDLTPLLKLKREFMAETKKLLRVEPALVSNRELVKFFTSCLERNFKAAIYSRLGSQANPGNANRRKDDPYDLNDIIATAIDMASGTNGLERLDQSYTSVSAIPLSTSKEIAPIKQEVEQMRQEIVNMKDILFATSKKTSSEIDQLMKTVRQTTMSPGPSTTFSQQFPRQNNLGTCFYCNDSGHMLATCPKKKSQLESGKLKLVDGKFFLADGSQVRRSDGNSWYERVENQAAAISTNENNMLEQMFNYGVPEQTSREDVLDSFKQALEYVQQTRGTPRYHNEMRGEMPDINPRDSFAATRSSSTSEQGF